MDFLAFRAYKCVVRINDQKIVYNIFNDYLKSKWIKVD